MSRSTGKEGKLAYRGIDLNDRTVTDRNDGSMCAVTITPNSQQKKTVWIQLPKAFPLDATFEATMFL